MKFPDKQFFFATARVTFYNAEYRPDKTNRKKTVIIVIQSAEISLAQYKCI